MELGLGQVVKDGNGNALLYTALIAAIAANSLPTPFDGIYFRRVNSLHRRYNKNIIYGHHYGMEPYLGVFMHLGVSIKLILKFY